MGYLDPVLPLICSLISGYAFCLWLSTLRSKAKIALVATVVLIAAAVISLYGMWGETEFLISIPISGASFLIGYILMSLSLGKEVRGRGDENDYEGIEGERIIIYLGQGEPEHYSSIASRRIRREEALDGRQWTVLRRPFAFWRLRRVYAQLGRSAHRDEHQSIMDGLRERLKNAGLDLPLLVAFHEDDPSFERVMERLSETKASEVVVARSYLVDIWGTEIAVQDLRKNETSIALTGPLWDSPRLREGAVRRVMRTIGGKESETAVVLVARLPERGEEWIREAEERERTYLDSLREDLQGLGIKDIRIARVGAQLERTCAEMVESGVRKVAYFLPFNTVESIDDVFLRESIKEFVGEGIDILRIDAWNDDEEVIQELADRVSAAFSRGRG